MKFLRWFLLLTPLILASLQCSQIGPPGGRRDPYREPTWSSARRNGRSNSNSGYSQPSYSDRAGDSGDTISLWALRRQVNLKVDLVRAGSYGRRVVRPMTPRYITIHSTENYTAGAAQHSLALKHGALRSGMRPGGNRIGFLIWHFTVDQSTAIQHMPMSEQGEHADFNGPGNRLSIGIEMCENRGCSWTATMDRTAKLTAVLMKQNAIPLQNVVPHYHWPRRGKNPPNKNCPHKLMDDGRPGVKWRGFLQRVNSYYRRIDS